MRAALVALLALALAAGCGGEDHDELQAGTVRIGVVRGERLVVEGVRVAVNRIDNAGGIGGVLAIELEVGTAEELLRDGVRLLVLPCREGLVRSARLAEARGALAVAPCDDGVLDPDLLLVFVTGLSPRAQAEALERHLGDAPVRVLRPETARGRRVAVHLRLAAGEATPVSPDAPERPTPPLGAAEGTLFATPGFPDPGGRTDEFAERFRSVYGRRPETILAALAADALDSLAVAIEEAASPEPDRVAAALLEGLRVRGALGDLEFEGDTTRASVAATIVRVEGGRLRFVDRV